MADVWIVLMYMIQISAADLQIGIANEYVRLYTPT